MSYVAVIVLQSKASHHSKQVACLAHPSCWATSPNSEQRSACSSVGTQPMSSNERAGAVSPADGRDCAKCPQGSPAQRRESGHGLRRSTRNTGLANDFGRTSHQAPTTCVHVAKHTAIAVLRNRPHQKHLVLPKRHHPQSQQLRSHTTFNHRRALAFRSVRDSHALQVFARLLSRRSSPTSKSRESSQPRQSGSNVSCSLHL